MSMSRSTRRQLLARDLVQGAVDAVRAAYARDGDPVPESMQERLERLLGAAQEGARHVFPGTGPDGLWRLTVAETRAYSGAVGALSSSLTQTFGPTIDAREYVSAALAWIEDLRSELPAEPEGRARAWAVVAEELDALYRWYDPALSEVARMDAGGAAMDRFRAATGVW